MAAHGAAHRGDAEERRVGERLAERTQQGGDVVEADRAGVEVDAGVARAEKRGDGGRRLGLVVGRVGRPDVEGEEVVLELSLRSPADERRVDPAAQHGAERHVALELAGDGSRDELAGAVGRPLERRHTPPRAGDVPHTLADMSKARALMDFAPRVGFDEGLRRTVDFFREAYA